MTTNNKNQDHGHHKTTKSDHDAKAKTSAVAKKASTAAKSSHSSSSTATKTATHGKQGFASMPKSQVKEIASKGGKTTHSDKSHK